VFEGKEMRGGVFRPPEGENVTSLLFDLFPEKGVF